MTDFLYPLADPDSPSTTCPDDARQQPVRLRLLGIVLHGVIQVLELLVADPPERVDEGAQLAADLVALGLPLRDHLQQRADLRVVVVADLRLDGLGARHRRLAAHDGRRPPQPVRHGRPQRVQRRRAHAVPRDQRVERVEVPDLLVEHVLHQRPQVRVPRDDGRRLRRVDERRGQLARLVDAQGGGEEVSLLFGQGLELALGRRGRGGGVAISVWGRGYIGRRCQCWRGVGEQATGAAGEKCWSEEVVDVHL